MYLVSYLSPSTQYLVVLVLFIITELGLAIGAIVKSGSLVGHHCLLPVPHISFLCREAVDENIAKILDNYSTDNTDRNAINFVQRTVSAHTNLPPLTQLYFFSLNAVAGTTPMTML